MRSSAATATITMTTARPMTMYIVVSSAKNDGSGVEVDVCSGVGVSVGVVVGVVCGVGVVVGVDVGAGVGVGA